MNAKTETQQFQLDGLKWLLIFGIIAGATYLDSTNEIAILYRVLAWVGVGIVVCGIAYYTQKGRAFWDLLVASNMERKKVIWPTHQERLQTTMVVLVVVIIVALILWGLDSIFAFAAAKIIG